MILNDFLNGIISALVSVLPQDPFISSIEGFNSAFGQYIGYINYFIPFGKMCDILALWIVSVGLWYAYRALASWLHLVS